MVDFFPITIMSRNRWSADRSAFRGRRSVVPFPHPLPRLFLLTLSFYTKKQNLWCQVTEICQTYLMVFVAYGQGRIQGDRIKGMPPTTSHFGKSS